MSEIKLFKVISGKAAELQGDASDLEKPLQTLIENNLETLLGIRFLATEYSTGKTHGGRIDSLGLDENNCPVILEYKRSVGENVINQGLFYLDWLMDHKAEFEKLVAGKLGAKAAESVDWSEPRVICIASNFTKYDAHAVQQIGRSIELINYRMFGDELLLLEQANVSQSSGKKTSLLAKPAKPGKDEPAADSVKKASSDKAFAEIVADHPPHLVELMSSLEDFVLSLGDDVQRKELKLYVAYKRIKNFASVVAQKSRLLLYLHLNPGDVQPLPPNARDVSQQGHWGTGDVEVAIATLAELDAVKSMILMAYEGRSGGKLYR
jgi:predicted transport protein